MIESFHTLAQLVGYITIFSAGLELFSFIFAKLHGRDSTMVLVRFPFSFPKFVKLDKNIHLSDCEWNEETNEYDFSYTFYNKLSDKDAEKIISEFNKNKFLIIVQVSEDNVPFDED